MERIDNFINTIGSSPYIWVKFIDDHEEDENRIFTREEQ